MLPQDWLWLSCPLTQLVTIHIIHLGRTELGPGRNQADWDTEVSHLPAGKWGISNSTALMLLPSTFPALFQHLLPQLSTSLQALATQKTCLQYYHNQTQQGYAMDRLSYGYCNCFQCPVTQGRESVIKACAHSLALPCRQGSVISNTPLESSGAQTSLTHPNPSKRAWSCV